MPSPERISESSTTRPMEPQDNWTLGDVVDLVFLIEQDREVDPAELAERDRRLFLNVAAPNAPAGPADDPSTRRRLIRLWLESRRRQINLPAEAWPGTTVLRASRLLRQGLSILGALVGASAASALLRYDGVQPINIAGYFAWLILAQLIWVGATVGSLARRQRRRDPMEPGLATLVLQRLWAWVLSKGVGWLSVSGSTRSDVQSFLGQWTRQRHHLGPPLFWSLLQTGQYFGLFFNLGAFVATLALVVFSDRAFGWQSAVQFSPERVSQLVETLAIPWKELVPAAAPPSLAQIEGSRIVLKDGIKQLTTSDLVAWWPFLTAALVVYGLLPRIALGLYLGCRTRRSLRQLSFASAWIDPVLDRLVSPRLHVAGAPEAIENPTDVLAPARPNEPSRAPGPVAASLRPAELWFPPELASLAEAPDLAETLARRFQLRIVTKQSRTENGTAPAIAPPPGPAGTGEGTPASIVWLDEAWQPPIREKLETLRYLGRVGGDATSVLVLLVGRPQGRILATPISPTDWHVWSSAVLALGHAGLRVEPLVPRE